MNLRNAAFSGLAALALSMFAVAGAQAAPCGTGLDTSNVTFRGNNSDDCFGPVTANPNSLGDFNTALTGSSIGNGWQQFLTTQSTSVSVDWNGFRFTFSSSNPLNTGISGDWFLTITDLFPLANPTYPVTVDIVIAPKAGNAWAGYFFNDETFNLNGQSSGTWAIAFNLNPQGIPNALSHMNFLLRDFRGSQCSPTDPNCNPPGGSTPEPASLLLVGLGALGLGVFRRRSTRTAK